MKAVDQNKKPLALVVDDERVICDSLSGVLEDEGWQVVTATSGKQGIVEFKSHDPDLVFLDVWMPGMDGIETLQRLREITTDVPYVVMSGHGTIETAVKVTKLGAFDFLEKPLSLEKIIPILEQVKNRIGRREGSENGDSRYDLVGNSSAVEEIKNLIRSVAPRNSWVLITGENGTGKEIVARNIHKFSTRSAKPFVAVNCAAIPEELIESELFGHTKGAFTHAISAKKGKFELANHGTIFLDEIGDMSLKTQAKILRILQEKKFERLGDEESIEVDVRVIAATNKNLESEIEKGNFREDLYYRLNVIPIHVPPLRERVADIPLLAEHFVKSVALELKEPEKKLSPDVVKALQTYQWPGNVRELKNIIERLSVTVTSATIDLSHLPVQIIMEFESRAGDPDQDSTSGSLKHAKSEFEKSFILDKLEENQWNISKTADAIGIERSNLHRKLKSFGIDTKNLKG